jgi:hypothetical protein
MVAAAPKDERSSAGDAGALSASGHTFVQRERTQQYRTRDRNLR